MTITDVSASGVIAASGVGELVFKPTSRQSWVVQQVSIDAPNVGGAAACAVYRDNALITPMVPQADAAAGDPPIPVSTNQRLRVRWTAGVVGAQISAIVIYDDGN